FRPHARVLDLLRLRRGAHPDRRADAQHAGVTPTASGPGSGDHRGRLADPRRAHRVKPATTPIIAPTAPPNSNTSPARLAVMITLPALVPLASTNVAMNQPAAGANPPSPCWVPHAPSRQVARMATAKPTAASGSGPAP